jgi:hypothetical protein
MDRTAQVLRNINRSDHQDDNNVTAAPSPMDLENMRSLGIRTIDLICGCGRHKEVNVDAYAGSEAVPSMTRFFRCGACGKRPKTARPGRLHRGAAGSTTIRSMNLTEERYLPGDEALLLR